mmetsp:Transcript_30735/g.52484  ORF Transcript_30735/g.52484 Transcript_30735/m.52484 type:complete len:238 (+) Transcript_30735:831-1544(+)
MREHRFQDVSRLNDITLIEPRPMSRGGRMPSQSQFERVPRHNVVDESSCNAIERCLRAGRSAPTGWICGVFPKSKGGKFLSIEPILFIEGDASVRGKSHSIFGVDGLDCAVDELLGLGEEGFHVFGRALPGVFGEGRVVDVAVGYAGEVGLGAHFAVPFGIGIFEIKVSPRFGIVNIWIANLEVVQDGIVRASFGRRKRWSVFSSRHNIVRGIDHGLGLIARHINVMNDETGFSRGT